MLAKDLLLKRNPALFKADAQPSTFLSDLNREFPLERGYSITTLEGSTTPIKDATVVHGGQTLTTRLARGRVRSLVSSTSSERLVTAKDPAAQPSLFDDPTRPGSTPGERSDS